MRAHLPRLLNEATTNSVLGELGIIDPALLAREGERYLAGTNDSVGGALFFTTQTERWLKARLTAARGNRMVPTASKKTARISESIIPPAFLA